MSSEKKYVIVDVQGFKGLNNKFIVKEIGICFDLNNFKSFLIKSPYENLLLSEKEQKMMNWANRHHHGIEWNSGHYDLSQIQKFLKFHLKGYTVLVKGPQKDKWLSEIIDDNIIKITKLSDEDLSQSLKTLCELYPINVCCENHKSFVGDSAVCALKNALAVRNALEKLRNI